MFGKLTVMRNFKRCSSSVFSLSHDRFNVRGTIPPQYNFKGKKTVMAKGWWEFAQFPSNNKEITLKSNNCAINVTSESQGMVQAPA